MALIGRVIASHYAEPIDRQIAGTATLRDAPGEDTAPVRPLQEGERFALLDDSLGWAWGYAGEDRRVGYVPSIALAQ